MAAVTVASSKRNVEGALRKVYAKLTAPANNDTWDTGLKQIHAVNVTMAATPGSTTGNINDAVGATVSGGTVTFAVVGTARDLWVTVIGV